MLFYVIIANNKYQYIIKYLCRHGKHPVGESPNEKCPELTNRALSGADRWENIKDKVVRLGLVARFSYNRTSLCRFFSFPGLNTGWSTFFRELKCYLFLEPHVYNHFASLLPGIPNYKFGCSKVHQAFKRKEVKGFKPESSNIIVRNATTWTNTPG